MKYFIGVTDNKWFNYLSQLDPDEVNFWRPGGQVLKAINIGAPFLFKLHSPLDYIVGGGFLIRSEKLPLTLAWDAFGPKNGAKNINELRIAINNYRKYPSSNPQIGCIILNTPFFFKKEVWIPVPTNWSKNIVTGKTYDTNDSIGLIIWQKIENLLQIKSGRTKDKFEDYGESSDRYGKEYLKRSRLGQGAFRILVTDAYFRSCAITGDKTLPALEAAHIKDFSEDGPNQINNGILLRSDLHKLFDKGYLTITPEYHIEVSRKIKEEFENGRIYYPYHGKDLQIIPHSADERPSREYLVWHNTHRYNG